MTSPGVSSNPSRCLPFKIREVKLHLRLNFSHNIASFFFLFRVSDFHSLGGPTLKETKKLKILTYGIVKNAQDDVDFHDWLFFSRGRCHGLEKPAAKHDNRCRPDRPRGGEVPYCITWKAFLTIGTLEFSGP